MQRRSWYFCFPSKNTGDEVSRKHEPNVPADQAVLLADWADCSPFHVNRSGFRLILAKDWKLYVVNEADGLAYVYDTEQWGEWLRRIDIKIGEMFVYSDQCKPEPIFANDDTLRHITLQDLLREFKAG